MEVETDKNLL